MRIILIFMQYSTQSKKKVQELFASNSSSSFTLREIMERVPDIPKSSLYRIVDTLESDGFVRKVAVTGHREAAYQLYDSLSCPYHMHIRCTECGKTMHIDRETSSEIESIIHSRLGFSDCLSTVFRGICPECMKKGE